MAINCGQYVAAHHLIISPRLAVKNMQKVNICLKGRQQCAFDQYTERAKAPLELLNDQIPGVKLYNNVARCWWTRATMLSQLFLNK